MTALVLDNDTLPTVVEPVGDQTLVIIGNTAGAQGPPGPQGPASGPLTNGDKGDITVSGAGDTWTIDNDSVSYAKMQNVSAGSRLLGRGASVAGDPQEITLGGGLSMTGTTLSAAGGGGYITFEEHGAEATPGFNNLPAIRAAYAAAKASGINAIGPAKDWQTYELWAPVVAGGTVTTADTFDAVGNGMFLTITSDLTIWGRNCHFSLKSTTGGSLQTGTQTVTAFGVPGTAWRGHFLNLVGGASGGAALPRLSGFNFTADGGCDRGGPGNIGTDFISHKGLRVQDTDVGEMYFENVELYGFRGEVWYFASSNQPKTTLVVCKGHTTAQSAINPNNGNFTDIGGEYGNAHLAIESLGGYGQVWEGTTFYDSTQAGFSGGANGPGGLGFNFGYPVRLDTIPPPMVEFRNVTFRACRELLLSSYTMGSATCIDTFLTLNANYTGSVTNIDLDVKFMVDRQSTTALISLCGPPTLTTLIGGAPAGNYIKPISDLHIRASVSRTALGKANSTFAIAALIFFDAGGGHSGYFDQDSCSVTLGNCDGVSLGSYAPTPPKGLPLIRTVGEVSSHLIGAGNPRGAHQLAVSASPFVILPTSDRHALNGAAASAYTMQMATTMEAPYTFAFGQRVRIFYGASGTAGATFAFAKNGSGLRLNADRTLGAYGDWLELEFNQYTAKWHEVGFNIYTA